MPDDPEEDEEASRGRNLCDDCGASVVGTDLQIPYLGERVLYIVTVCGCGINIELLRQIVDADKIPCVFCDEGPHDGLPWITHTHETTQQIW